MLQFLPHNLDIDQVLQNNPPVFPYQRDSFIHILSLLTEIPAKKKELLNGEGFIPLNSTILKTRVHNYAQYINYLLEEGIIETDNYYTPGDKSRGYRFAEQYRTLIEPTDISKYTLLKSINNKSKYDRNMCAKYNYLYKWWDERLQIDYDGAKSHLEQCFQKDKEQNYYRAVRKYNSNLATALCMKENMVRFRIDQTSGRCHTYLTTLKKGLRNFVTFDGQILTSIDIRCSQPTLSTLLLKPEFYQDIKDTGMLNLHRLAPELVKKIPIGEITRLVCTHEEKFRPYINAVESDLYECMRAHLEDLTGREWKDRAKIKEAMFAVLYSDNRFIAQKEAEPKRLFKSMYPEVYEVFSLYKKHGASALPVLLQKIEAKLVLDSVAKKLAKQNPDMPLFSIHDSLIVPIGYEDLCKEEMLNEGRRLMGIDLKLQTEIFSPVNGLAEKKVE
ncbi:MAG: hypothetical protein ACLQQ4_15180 [Bacteroidia bacterium]